MIKVAIVGIAGKMGNELFELFQKEKGIKVIFGVDKNPCSFGIPVFKDFSSIKKKVDFLIDFSSPSLSKKALVWVAKNRVGYIGGTTGLTESHFSLMRKVSKYSRVFWSPNMSVGINFLKKIIPNFQNISDWDFQIEEIHHRYKKDKPSGTAIYLQNTLKEAVLKPTPEPFSIRGGGVFGVHKIIAMSDSEIITIEHQALNRQVFAEGVLRAAKWLDGKKAGLYTFENILE